jgi:hypothetical protein
LCTQLQQSGGYIVTRTTSGRELFIPHNMHVQHPHTHPNSSAANSDSGYVGTSSTASSRYPYSLSGDGVEGSDHQNSAEPPSWPKAAHRTISAQTISSFGGDDVLEVLPGKQVKRGNSILIASSVLLKKKSYYCMSVHCLEMCSP